MSKLPGLNIGDLEGLILAGMGVGVSGYKLANVVSRNGGLGVVSGTALSQLLVRELQLGDPSGDIRSALGDFPNQDVASSIVDNYFIEGGKSTSDRFKQTPFPRFDQVGEDSELITLANNHLKELIVAANFVEVNLAKRGHDNPVGINYLHKIQWPLLPSIYGAMLAGVDAVLIGAGLPREIPDVLDGFSNGKSVVAPISVTSPNKFSISFDPKEVMGEYKALNRPLFLGIVSGYVAARALQNHVDGYIVEGHIAGGHNAPARGKEYTENGEPVYGVKDEMDFVKLNKLIEKMGKGQRYFLAGGYASRLAEAMELGASGVQVGSAFAFCRESRIESRLKRNVLEKIMNGGVVYTDPRVSPSGFPFKVFQIDGTLSDEDVRNARVPTCNLGYLLELYESKGRILSRCSAEPESSYVKKGGSVDDKIGRGCICNGLLPTIGLGNSWEPPVVTVGSDLEDVRKLVEIHGLDYTAKDVISYVLADKK